MGREACSVDRVATELFLMPRISWSLLTRVVLCESEIAVSCTLMCSRLVATALRPGRPRLAAEFFLRGPPTDPVLIEFWFCLCWVRERALAKLMLFVLWTFWGSGRWKNEGSAYSLRSIER